MLNQKGGVGKTSTCYHLAGTLAAGGRRVLLVDNDPQASLTQGFWGPQATRQLDPAETIAASRRGRAFPGQVIRPSGIAGIDLVPGSRHAARFNVAEPHEADSRAQACLREFLADVRDRYDLVLIDCPPNLHLCSWAALVASDSPGRPPPARGLRRQGIIDVQESVAWSRPGRTPASGCWATCITMMTARKSVHQVYEERLRELYGAAGLRGPRARGGRVRRGDRTSGSRSPQYKPKGAAAKAMKALAEELLARLARTTGSSQGGRVMGKLDELMPRSAGGNVDESMGVAAAG